MGIRRFIVGKLVDEAQTHDLLRLLNNRNGKFAYITIGAENVVKVFRRSSTPELVAAIPVGNLPHGIWPPGDGARVYVALENGEQAVESSPTTGAARAAVFVLSTRTLGAAS